MSRGSLLSIVLILVTVTSCSLNPKQENSTLKNHRQISHNEAVDFHQLPNFQEKIGYLEKWVRDLNGELGKGEGQDRLWTMSVLSHLETITRTVSEDGIPLLEIEPLGAKFLQQLFSLRLSMHNSLEYMNAEQKGLLRSLFLNVRRIEDEIGKFYYKTTSFIPNDKTFKGSFPVPLYEKDAYTPYFVNPKFQIGAPQSSFDEKGVFQFQPGDIFITMGVSFVSSTIAELATPQSLFSHIVFVIIDDKGHPKTIESYIGMGVTEFTMEKALKNNNARILVLRPKDKSLGLMATKAIIEKTKQRKHEHPKSPIIPYDFSLDFSDHQRMSCEEVAYYAYKTASQISQQSTMILPEVESQILMDDENLLKRLGVKKGPMMIPSDMETDSRFEIVLDFTDHRLNHDNLRKHAVVASMFSWMKNYKYKIYEELSSVAALAIWKTRDTFLWPMLASLAGFPKEYVNDIPDLTIRTMGSLKVISTNLYKELLKRDLAFLKANQRPMKRQEMLEALDQYRKENPPSLRVAFREKGSLVDPNGNLDSGR